MWEGLNDQIRMPKTLIGHLPNFWDIPTFYDKLEGLQNRVFENNIKVY